MKPAPTLAVKNQPIDGYWFAESDRLPHGDGRKIVIGEAHSVKGEIVLCENGLHASRHPYDALSYIAGPYLYKVRCSGDIVEDTDKFACRTREYVAVRDALPMLLAYSRECASSVLHLWDAPDVVKDFLATGNNARAAARAADAAACVAAHAAACVAATWAADAAHAAARAAHVAADAACVAAGTATMELRGRFAALVDALFAEEPK